MENTENTETVQTPAEIKVQAIALQLKKKLETRVKGFWDGLDKEDKGQVSAKDLRDALTAILKIETLLEGIKDAESLVYHGDVAGNDRLEFLLFQQSRGKQADPAMIRDAWNGGFPGKVPENKDHQMPTRHSTADLAKPYLDAMIKALADHQAKVQSDAETDANLRAQFSGETVQETVQAKAKGGKASKAKAA